MRIRRMWDVLRGYPSSVERDTIDRIGEMPNIVEAHEKLVSAQKHFFDAVKGVVAENEELRRRLNAEKDT